MSRTDRLKEQIGWLKAFFLVLVAADLSLLGWLAQNFRKEDTAAILVGITAIVCTTSMAVHRQRRAGRCMDELEQL